MLAAAREQAGLSDLGDDRILEGLAINLLAADPMRRCFLRWEAFASVPPAKAGELRCDPRYHAEQARL